MFGFTEAEFLPYVGIFLLVVFVLLSSYRKGFYGICSPLAVIAVIFAYYCLLGPYKGVSTGQTMDRLQNMRPYYESALWGAFFSLLSIVIGFKLNNKKAGVFPVDRSVQDSLLGYYGKWVFMTGFVLYTIATKGNILSQVNPLDAEAVQKISGGFANYLNLSLNFLIPGVAMLFAYFIRTRRGFWWVVIPFLLALGLFITLGFRYRIVLLIGAMAITYYLYLGKRPSLAFMALGIFLFITFMGIINITRKYGRGLDLNRLEGGTEVYYSKGLEEARIFQTSGAVMDNVPERFPYSGIQPIVSTLLFPIPRTFFPEKGSADYVFNVLDVIYGENVSKGAAFMNYAEHYMMFGWAGIFIGGFLIGWFSRKLWNWYLVNWQHPLVVVAYAVTVVYLYVIISRGYLPQVTMLFFFSVFPVYVVTYLVKKKYRFRNRPISKRIVSRAA